MKTALLTISLLLLTTTSQAMYVSIFYNEVYKCNAKATINNKSVGNLNFKMGRELNLDDGPTHGSIDINIGMFFLRDSADNDNFATLLEKYFEIQVPAGHEEQFAHMTIEPTLGIGLNDDSLEQMGLEQHETFKTSLNLPTGLLEKFRLLHPTMKPPFSTPFPNYRAAQMLPLSDFIGAGTGKAVQTTVGGLPNLPDANLEQFFKVTAANDAQKSFTVKGYFRTYEAKEATPVLRRIDYEADCTFLTAKLF